MKVALIPPDSLLEWGGDYQLCLAQRLLKKPYLVEYFKQYKGHLILDNGAYEGECVTPKQLKILASQIRPAEVEVVYPDVLKDAQATLCLAQETHSLAIPGDPMIVPQGTSLKEWKQCLIELIRIVGYKTVSAIGIPVLYDRVSWLPYGRLDLITVVEDVRDLSLIHI